MWAAPSERSSTREVKPRRIGPFLLALVAAVPGSARVVSTSEAGIVVESSVRVAATPDRVWATLIVPARWWSPEHSWSGEAKNFTLEARAGGCFCEVLPGGGSVEHLRVIYVAPAQMLRLYGGLGPLQGDAAAGPLTWTLAKDGAGTRVSLRYAVAGVARMPWPVFAPLADTMLAEQLTRLKAAAEAR
ncbi:ATPase [bacterium]|nr:MAG: ATPase [bacterium]